MPEFQAKDLMVMIGCSVATFYKHVKQLGIEPLYKKGLCHFYDQSVVEMIKSAIQQQVKSPVTKRKTKSGIDPSNGLPWGQSLMKEKTIQLVLENENELRKLSDKWILASVCQEMLSAGIQRLEQVPGKIKSEIGLREDQITIIRRMLDEVRQEWAIEVETKLKPKAEKTEANVKARDISEGMSSVVAERQ